MRRAIVGLTCVVGLLLGSVRTAGAQVIDPGFSPAVGIGDDVYALAIQPDGKLLVAGNYSTLSGNGGGPAVGHSIGRLNADGTLDASFNPGSNGQIYTMAVQPNGKILIGGIFTAVGGGSNGTTPRASIARLNGDGTVDTGFNPGANSLVRTILLQPDGKILVGGLFSVIGGATRRGLARLNADGTVDPGFDPGVDLTVHALALQPDGQILVGGQFTLIGGSTGVTPRQSLARLAANGSVDLTFDPGVTTPSANTGTVYTLIVQPDGKILVAGNFSGFGGGSGSTAHWFLGRLLDDGTVDSFDPGVDGPIVTMALETDGRILIGGLFTKMGGGGTGATQRLHIGRLNADGSLDGFDPGTNNSVEALTLRPDGSVIVGGPFTAIGGGTGSQAVRIGLGRIFNSDPATESLALSAGNTTLTWLRGGTSPEAVRVEFATSTDGVTYTTLGTATRVAGGWQMTGLSLPAGPTVRLRGRAFYTSGYLTASSSIADTIAPPSGANFIGNGTFTSGSTSWLLFATPDISYIQSNVTGGVFQFYRVAPPVGTSNQAVAFQQTGMALPAVAPLEATFQLGNTDSVRKRISVLVHDSDFSDLSVCTFWLPPNAPLGSYTIRTHTTRAWTDATISFYAASANAAGNTTGFYQIDNVSVAYLPANTATATTCVDPTAPTPPGGAPSGNLLMNGDFASGALVPWTLFGQINGSITGGVFEFIKLAGTPAGVVLQATSQAIPASQILTTTFQLGNSSSVRKRVTVILHDNDFSDLSACTFWLPPLQPLSTYTYRTFATRAWTNATVSVYPATTGPDQWIRLDNVTLQTTPGAALTGTHCIEPGGAVPDVAAPVRNRPAVAAAPVLRSTDRAADVAQPASGEWIGNGFAAAEGTTIAGPHAWVAEAAGAGRRVLQLIAPIDLSRAATGTLHLRSWLAGTRSRAEIQMTIDGVTWEALRRVDASDTWMPIEIDLGPGLGRVVSLRFVLDTETGGTEPDVWWIEGLEMSVEPR